MPRGRNVGSDWSEEELAVAERHWKAGWSAGQIAAVVKRSRNAVLGMADRNRERFPRRARAGGRTGAGPSLRADAWLPEITTTAMKMWAEGAAVAAIGEAIGKTAGAVTIYARTHRDQFPLRAISQTMSSAPLSVGRPPVPAKAGLNERFPPPPAAPDCRPVTLMDRRANQCHFPLWENYGAKPTAESLYCGGAVAGESDYCAYHRALMYRPKATVVAAEKRRAA